MGNQYRILMSNVAGNNERLAFVYDGTKVTLLGNVGQLLVPPADHKHIKLPGITATFTGFDRDPYLGAFQVGNFTLHLASSGRDCRSGGPL
jgi:hypothetical protein